MDVDKNNESKPLEPLDLVYKNNKNNPLDLSIESKMEIDESPKKDILISQGLSKDLYILSSEEKGKKQSSPPDLQTPNHNNADR